MTHQVPPSDSWFHFPAVSAIVGSLISWRPRPQSHSASTIASAVQSPPLVPPPPLDADHAPILDDRVDHEPDLSPILRRQANQEPASPLSLPLRPDGLPVSPIAPRLADQEPAGSLLPKLNAPLSRSPMSTAPAQQATASSLQSEAKLSYAAQLVDKTSRLFWWTTSLPGRAVSTAKNKVINLAVKAVVRTAAKKGVSLMGAPAPETPLRQLRNCLFELRAKIIDHIEIDEHLRQRTITALGVFLADDKKCLADCYSPSAWVYSESLNREQRNKFVILLRALNERRSLANEEPFLQPLCAFLEKCCQYQSEAHEDKLASQMIKKVTGALPAPASAAVPETPARPMRQQSRARVPPAPAKPVPQNPVPLIVAEFEQLKSLGFRIALALLILPESSIHKKEEESGNLAALIRKSNTTLDPLKGPNEIFQDLLYAEIENSNLNSFQKKWRKFTCWLLAPSISFMINHILDQSRDTALYLIGLSPEERLDMVVKMFIEPGLGFIGWLQSEYKAIAGTENLGTTVEGAIGYSIDHIRIKDRHGKDLTSKDLINRLIGSLIDRYAPSLNWSRTGTAHFEQRAQESKSPFFSLWFISWSYLSWAVNILCMPGRWCMNKIVRKILKTVAVSHIHSKLTDKDGASWDFGRLALNSIYKTLYDKLLRVNRSERGAESEDSRRNFALEQRGFVEMNVQDSINKLVSDFLELLYIQGSNVNKLHAKLSPANFFEQGKKGVMEVAFAPGIQKATEEIIHSLQIFLQDSTFSAGVLEVMQDIHQQCLRFNTGDTETSLARLEKDFSIELKDAVKHGIQTVIEDKLDPTKQIQKEADLFVEGLSHDAAVFRTHFHAVQNFTPATVKKLLETRNSYLIDSIRRRQEKANKETNASTRTHIKSVSEHHYTLSAPICAKIDEIGRLVDAKKQLEDLTVDLGQLISPLEAAITSQPLPNATSHYTQLQLTLQRIKTKTYPERVQTLISRLQGHFDTWRTEILKRDNQTLLNGTILTLKAAVEAAIGQNQARIGEITASITGEYQETGLLVNGLAEWTGQLSYFVCVSERQEIDAIEHVLSYLGNEAISPFILGKLDDFFIFLGKNHHIKGILSFVIKAYLELPRKSMKDFKKILDQVKQSTQPLSSAPPSPFRN